MYDVFAVQRPSDRFRLIVSRLFAVADVGWIRGRNAFHASKCSDGYLGRIDGNTPERATRRRYDRPGEVGTGPSSTRSATTGSASNELCSSGIADSEPRGTTLSHSNRHSATSRAKSASGLLHGHFAWSF